MLLATAGAKGALMGSQDFSNPHGWPIGVRVVKGGGCPSGDPHCICAEEIGIDPSELWAVIDIYSIDDFRCGHTRPIVLCCGCKTREQAERDADQFLLAERAARRAAAR